MRKVPTLFRRAEDRRHVTDEITPGCEWVLAGEGTPTRKYDGTCVRFDGERWWARREVKPGKMPPPEFLPTEHDPVTGKTVGWEPVEQSGYAKAHAEALAITDRVADEAGEDPTWDAGTYEMCGPRVNGNPEGFDTHRLVRHADAEVLDLSDEPPPYTAAEIRHMIGWVAQHGWEGIVWHHPDGRMAKLKARELPARSTPGC